MRTETCLCSYMYSCLDRWQQDKLTQLTESHYFTSPGLEAEISKFGPRWSVVVFIFIHPEQIWHTRGIKGCLNEWSGLFQA